jgi:biotin carboxyl carrier protein
MEQKRFPDMKKVILIDGYPLPIDHESKNWTINSFKPGCFTIKGRYQGHNFNSSLIRVGNKYNVNINGASFVVETVSEDYFNEVENINTDESKVISPMTGLIREILVNTGDMVTTGQVLLRIESMKLVLTVNSAIEGIIKEIRVKTGQKISAGDLILEINN